MKGQKLKRGFSNFVSYAKTTEGKIRILTVIIIILGVFIFAKGATMIYLKATTKTVFCKYESAVEAYSKLKIENTVTYHYRKGKMVKEIDKWVYTIYDDSILDSYKNDKKMQASTFKDIKGVSAKYKAKGSKISVVATYNIAKMEKEKKETLPVKVTSTMKEAKEYWKSMEYKCE